MEDSSRKRKAEDEDVVDDESEGGPSADEEPVVPAPGAPSQGNDTAAEAQEASDSAADSVEQMEVTGQEEDEGQLERNAAASSPVPSDTALDVMADGPAMAEVSVPDAPLPAPSTESAEAVAGAVSLADAGKKKKKQKMEVPPRSIPTRASGGGADSPVKIDEASTTLTKGGSLPRELKNLMLDDNANKRKREGDEVVFIQSGAKPPRKVRLSHNGGMSEVHAGALGTRRSPRVAGDLKEGLPPALAGFAKPKTESAASAGGGGHAKGGSATAAVGAKGAITTGAGKRASVVGTGGSGGVAGDTSAPAAAVGGKGGVAIAGSVKGAAGGGKKGHGGKGGGGGKGGKGGKRASTSHGGAQAESTAAFTGDVAPVDAAVDGGGVKAPPAPVDGTTAKEASALVGDVKDVATDAPVATNADTESASADVGEASLKPVAAGEAEAQAAGDGGGGGGDGDAKSALSVDAAGGGGAAVAEGASQKLGDAANAKAVTVVGPAQKKQAVVRIVEVSGEAAGAKRERRKGELMKLMDDPVAAAVASRKAAGEDAGKGQAEGVSAGPSLSRSTRSRTHEAVASAEGKDDGSQVQGGTEQEKQEAADAEDKRKGRWRAFGKGPPKKLVFTDDRLHKCVKLDDVIFIGKRDADTGAHEGKAFEWNEKGYFIVALHNANDERVKPSEFDNARVQYIVASTEDDGSQEELYSGSVSATAHHGSYYFKALHFLLPGTYTLSFKLLNDKYKKCTLELTTKVCIEGTDPSAPQPRPTPPPPQPASADTESQPTSASTATSSAPAPPPPPPLLKPRTRSTTPTGGASSSSSAAPSAAASAQPAPTKLTAGISSSSTSSVHKGRRSRHTDTHKEGEAVKSEPGGPEVISNDGHGDADGSLNFDDALQRGPIISLRVPGALRKVLLEDWFCVTRKRKLVPLPCTHTVAEIVKNFEKDTVLGPRRTNKGQGPGERLCHLFNGAVASLLLYRFEKEQYLAAYEKTKALPQNLYGAHHLLRLLVSAPRFFTPDETDPSTAPFAVLKQRHSSTSSATGSMAAAAASSAAGGTAANADVDNKGKARASSSSSTELKVPTALSDEVEGIRLYLQGLLDYLDEHRDKVFTDHEDVPERYGVDVPKVAPPRAPKSSSSSASAAAAAVGGSGEKGASAPAAVEKTGA